jgi:hypothetical protein
LVFCAAATASANPAHVTVLDFEGPSRLADAARQLVIATLAEGYDIVAKRWEVASSSTASGPLQWSAAAKAAGVDAVIEGWIDPDGGATHTMTVAVRDASTGRQIDTISIEISDQGAVSDEQTRKLSRQLDDVLSWVDTSTAQPDPPPARLPAVSADRSYPAGEPVIEVLLTGGFFGHHQGAVVWPDGTVQMFGPRGTQRGKLTPTRVATLIDTLDRSGIFAAGSNQSLCMDGLDVEVDVRSNSRRVTARSSLCGYGETAAVQAYDLVWSALGPNPCVEHAKSDDSDDDD